MLVAEAEEARPCDVRALLRAAAHLHPADAEALRRFYNRRVVDFKLLSSLINPRVGGARDLVTAESSRDLLPLLVEASEAGGEPLYYRVDRHLTAAGNRVAVEAIGAFLEADAGL